jgi:hypothetical protein
LTTEEVEFIAIFLILKHKEAAREAMHQAMLQAALISQYAEFLFAKEEERLRRAAGRRRRGEPEDPDDSDRATELYRSWRIAVRRFRITLSVAGEFRRIANDPPDPRYREVGLTARARPGAPRRRGSGLVDAARADRDAVADVRRAALGLALAGDRFGGARRARSAEAMLLQSAVGKAYAGQLAATLSRSRRAGAAFARALRSAGLPARVSRARVRRAAHALGRRAARLAGPAAEAVADLPSSVSLRGVLGAAPPSGVFRDGARSMTIAEMEALIDGLAGQHDISATVADRLHADLAAFAEAPDDDGRLRAIEAMLDDGPADGAVATLFEHAVRGLAGE